MVKDSYVWGLVVLCLGLVIPSFGGQFSYVWRLVIGTFRGLFSYVLALVFLTFED